MKTETDAGEWDHSFDEDLIAQKMLAAYAFYRDDRGGRTNPDSIESATQKAQNFVAARIWKVKWLLRHEQKPLRGKRRGNADLWLAKLVAIRKNLEAELGRTTR